MNIYSKKEIEKVLTEKKIPHHDFILQLADQVSTILEEEVTSYREVNSEGNPGGLLDFQEDDLPLIVVPDLHGRTEFLFNIINFILPKDFLGKRVSVFNALQEQLVRIIFVGDILHTERNTKFRWLEAQKDFLNENFTGKAMEEEMAESLSLWAGVFMLKTVFPEFCHILKGNHENIYNISSKGDYSFKKFANEGAMVKAFIQEYYGDDILYMIHCVESALALAVVNRNCVISHAEPRESFSKQQIIDARLEGTVVAGLTWTDNDEAEDGSVCQVIKNLSHEENIDSYVYLGGHRCVRNKYEFRQDGNYIQIHNPDNQNVALVYNNRKFNPENDIVGVQK